MVSKKLVELRCATQETDAGEEYKAMVVLGPFSDLETAQRASEMMMSIVARDMAKSCHGDDVASRMIIPENTTH